MKYKQQDDYLYLKSPFSYKDGLTYHCSNKKITCTFDEIQSFIVKNMLTALDWDILSALYKYRFLNKHLITLFLPEQDVNKIKRKLSKMVEQGLILRFFFSTNGGDISPDMPYFYSLSKGAYSFLKRRYPLSSVYENLTNINQIPTTIELLKRLVTNQFHIAVNTTYNGLIKKDTFYQTIKYKELSYFINCHIRLEYKIPNKKGALQLAIFIIRRQEGWETDYINTIYAYIDAVNKNILRYRNSIPLFICEDDLHIKESYLIKESSSIARNVFALYTSDTTLLTQPVFNHLYQCEIITDFNIVSKGLKEDNSMFNNTLFYTEGINIEEHVKMIVTKLEIQ